MSSDYLTSLSDLADITDVFREPTSRDLEYLHDKYPFVQFINPDGLFTEESKIQHITAESGWTIVDYGDALCSSPGEFLYQGEDSEKFLTAILAGEKEDEDGGEGGEKGGGGANPGKGTIIKQTVDTVVDMIKIVLKKGWSGILIINGTPFMKWCSWYLATENHLNVEGFMPSEEEEKKRDRLSKIIRAEITRPAPTI
jgi:hypothetical protein